MPGAKERKGKVQAPLSAAEDDGVPWEKPKAKKEAPAPAEEEAPAGDPDAKHPEYMVAKVIACKSQKKGGKVIRGSFVASIVLSEGCGVEEITVITSAELAPGNRVVFAPEGSTVSGKEVKKQKVQGEWSCGAFCTVFDLSWPGDASKPVLLSEAWVVGDAAPLNAPKDLGVVAVDAPDAPDEDALDEEQDEPHDDIDYAEVNEAKKKGTATAKAKGKATKGKKGNKVLEAPCNSSEKLRVRGSIFKTSGTLGDFLWMLEQEIQPRTLYIFNDNDEDHYTSRRGGGNACIRPFNRHNPHLDGAPRSAGVSTGFSSAGGFQVLDARVRAVIDRDISEIRDLLSTGFYDRVLYSAGSDGMSLGTDIFDVAQIVKDYILTQLCEFDGKAIAELMPHQPGRCSALPPDDDVDQAGRSTGDRKETKSDPKMATGASKRDVVQAAELPSFSEMNRLAWTTGAVCKIAPFREIRAIHDSNIVRVYQAYSVDIAAPAAAANSFRAPLELGKWSSTRMTWIKPSATWMAYRCGWGVLKDKNQAAVLALDLSRRGFAELLKMAQLSHSKSAEPGSLRNSPVVVQWDPERVMDRSKNNSKDALTSGVQHMRSIQIGLRGKAVEMLLDPEVVVRITDVTPAFTKAHQHLSAEPPDVDAAVAALWPDRQEEQMVVPLELREQLQMDVPLLTDDDGDGEDGDAGDAKPKAKADSKSKGAPSAPKAKVRGKKGKKGDSDEEFTKKEAPVAVAKKAPVKQVKSDSYDM